jgi:hypothetical protein
MVVCPEVKVHIFFGGNATISEEKQKDAQKVSHDQLKFFFKKKVAVKSRITVKYFLAFDDSCISQFFSKVSAL